MSGMGGLRSYSNSVLTSARSAGVEVGRREGGGRFEGGGLRGWLVVCVRDRGRGGGSTYTDRGGLGEFCGGLKLRFFRLGIPVCAYVDGHQQRMSASTLKPKDVAFAISNSGRSRAVIAAIEIARSYGATTVALTRPKTPLAAAAEVVIPIVIPEDANALAYRLPLRPYGGD